MCVACLYDRRFIDRSCCPCHYDKDKLSRIVPTSRQYRYEVPKRFIPDHGVSTIASGARRLGASCRVTTIRGWGVVSRDGVDGRVKKVQTNTGNR